MNNHYDLVVIGAGSGGLTAAEFAAKLGAQVALVERDRVGGDCTWTGCVPSKALLQAAKVAHTVNTAVTFGIHPPGKVQVDMAQVCDYVQQAIHEIYRRETPELLTQSGIDVISGAAAFLDEQTVQVGGSTLTASKFILATGAQAAVPPIAGLAMTPFLTYERFFDNDVLPDHLIILGAGPTGVEMAQAYSRFGAQVTLIDVGLLPTFDAAVGQVMTEVLARDGVRFVPGLAAAVAHHKGQFQVTTNGNGSSPLAGDMLLVATGRRPTVSGLGLENAGVKFSKQGIEVNDHLQTSNRNIYAVGDCTGGFQATHYAGWQGFQAARNGLLPGQSRGISETVPLTIYTDPEVAQVGLTVAQAEQKFGADVCVAQRPLSHFDRAITDNKLDGFVKIVHKKDGSLLGATIIAPHAGEMIVEFVHGLRHKWKLRDIAETFHPYPTYAIGTQRLAADVASEQFLTSTTGRLVRRMRGFRAK